MATDYTVRAKTYGKRSPTQDELKEREEYLRRETIL